MLEFIRDKMQGWIAWAIVILLIIPFALWGINEYFGTGGPLVAATVNGEEISQRDFQQAYLQQRSRMREMLGGQYDPSLFDAQIKKQAIDDLINREILLQNAKDNGFRIAEESVVDTIRNIEAFKDNGAFSNEMYVRQLQAQGESPAGFERRIHRAILTQQLPSGVSSTAIVTDQELQRILKLEHQTRDIDHLRIEVAKYQKDEDATEDAIEAYYNEYRDQFMNPEQVSLEYIELKASDLGKDAQPTEEELNQFYEERVSQFRVPEERRSRHILISVQEDADEQTINSAKDKANEIKQKLDSGESFEKLAEEFSDDPGSAKLGGDIGFFGRGQLDPAYEETMYALKQGEISEPVLSSFGFHIIQLEEIRAEKSKSFDEVKDELIADFRKNISDRKFFEDSDKLTTLAYEVPDTLDDAAGAVGLDIKSTELFSRGSGVGVAANPKVGAAAFSNDVLVERLNSEPVELGENHIVVVRVKEHVEKSQKSMDEAKEDIKKRLIEEKAQERVKELGSKTVARLQAGDDIDAVAKELEIDWQKSGELKRTDRKIDSAIVQQAFKLTRPAESKSSFGSVELGNGDYAIISVNKVTDGNVAEIEESQKLTLKRTLSGLQGESDFENLLSELKESAQVIINEDEL